MFRLATGPSSLCLAPGVLCIIIVFKCCFSSSSTSRLYESSSTLYTFKLALSKMHAVFVHISIDLCLSVVISLRVELLAGNFFRTIKVIRSCLSIF